MSTALSQGRQFIVYNEEQIISECIKTNFIDCRLNAYSVSEESQSNELNIFSAQAPNILFIDIDLSKGYESQEEAITKLNNVLKKLNKIRRYFINKYTDKRFIQYLAFHQVQKVEKSGRELFTLGRGEFVETVVLLNCIISGSLAGIATTVFWSNLPIQNSGDDSKTTQNNNSNMKVHEDLLDLIIKEIPVGAMTVIVAFISQAIYINREYDKATKSKKENMIPEEVEESLYYMLRE